MKEKMKSARSKNLSLVRLERKLALVEYKLELIRDIADSCAGNGLDNNELRLAGFDLLKVLNYQ